MLATARIESLLRTRLLPAADPLDGFAPSGSDESAVAREADFYQTSVHIFEAVRNTLNELVDFRLSFDVALAGHPHRDFAGVKLVEVGPSVAPRETFHALKRVLESGEPMRSATRHACGLAVHFFQQTAERLGDSVVTTTTIVRQSCQAVCA